MTISTMNRLLHALSRFGVVLAAVCLAAGVAVGSGCKDDKETDDTEGPSAEQIEAAKKKLAERKAAKGDKKTGDKKAGDKKAPGDKADDKKGADGKADDKKASDPKSAAEERREKRKKRLAELKKRSEERRKKRLDALKKRREGGDDKAAAKKTPPPTVAAKAPPATKTPEGTAKKLDPKADPKKAAKTPPATKPTTAPAAKAPEPTTVASAAPTPVATAGAPPTPSNVLRISRYVNLKDVREITGKPELREAGTLVGIPPSSRYNAAMYTLGKKQDFGVAVQVWKEVTQRAADQRFKRMKRDYANVEDTDAVTTRGFFSSWNDLMTLVFFEPFKRTLVAVTCTTKVCTQQSLLDLAKRVKTQM